MARGLGELESFNFDDVSRISKSIAGAGERKGRTFEENFFSTSFLRLYAVTQCYARPRESRNEEGKR